MSRLSRDKERTGGPAGLSAAADEAPLVVRVSGATGAAGAGAPGATVDGSPLVTAPGEEIQHAVLDHLHRLALAAGRPVLATIHDERVGYAVPLRVDPDGASHLAGEPVPSPAARALRVVPAPGTVGAPEGAFGPPPRMAEIPGPGPRAVRGPYDAVRGSARAADAVAVPAVAPAAVPAKAESGAWPAPTAPVPADATIMLGPSAVSGAAPASAPAAAPEVSPVPEPASAPTPAEEPPPEGEEPRPAETPAPAEEAARAEEPAPAQDPDLMTAFGPMSLIEAAAGPGPRATPTPARGFDAVAEAVLGDGPITAHALLAGPTARIGEAVREGRTEEAARLAEATVADAARSLGPEHPEVCRLRELSAYIAYLSGDPRRAFRLSLDLAAVHHRAGDAEAAYGNVRSAATAWRAVREPALGLELGRELVALWEELAAGGGPAAEDPEPLESARTRMGRLTERARAARAE
ncbi:tetratricopeptide repeat protein [Streptomyces sp. NPDC048182]|uniref:tetratricopeptide repeat protein n=1 Tax=Streptomyces sp. NPDC048182 TaxID=3365507 RepID=UPI0037131B4D